MANMTKRGNNYLFRVFCGHDANGKQIVRSTTWKADPNRTERQNEKEAERQLMLFEQSCKAMASSVSGSIKFQALSEQYLREEAVNKNRPSSLQRLHDFEKRTYAAIGHLRVDKINARMIQSFINNLSEDGISERTLHAIPKKEGSETILRKVLRERGLSQLALARQAGPSESSVSSACRGGSVTAQTAESLSSALGMKLEDLFTPKSGEKSCLAPKTIKEYLSFVSSVMDYAVRSGIIAQNPCKNVSTPPSQDNEKEIYTEEEAAAFLASLEEAPSLYHAFFVLAIYSGLRRGELLGLQWNDIDFDHCTLAVRRTLHYTKGKGFYFTPPKTKKSARDLRLHSGVFDTLKRYRVTQAEGRLSVGDLWEENGLVFTSWCGKPLSPNTPYTWLKRFCEQTGQRFIGVHGFRHLNASLLINCGADVLTVSRSLGHSQSTTTLNIYAHSFSAAQARASEAIAEVLPLQPRRNQKKQSC